MNASLARSETKVAARLENVLRLRALFACVLGVALFLAANVAVAAKPNIIVILADDLGWRDLGVMGATDLKTPNIDALATNGVLFTSGYVTAPVCSPSRAGLMTGRYQQRFGHETNPGTTLETNAIFGLPLTESTIANRLKPFDYATGWIGKSHLGGDPKFWPLQRGFDEFFGFIQSHHHYLNPSLQTVPDDPIRRGANEVFETNYLTTAFARECLDFIDRHTNGPFFLYAPFNATHFPLEATSNLFSRFNTNDFGTNLSRYTNAAVLAGLDDAVGAIVARLQNLNLHTNTLIFFTSDNGGATNFGSINRPLRGEKTDVYEGGIRVPFIMNWPGQVLSNVVKDGLVSTLDILPTAIAAAGGTLPAAWQIDGVNLLPYASGQTTNSPHSSLFWRIETDGIGDDDVKDGIRAMRQGDWKLVKPALQSTWELYHLASDIGEATNLAAAFPGIMQQMVASYDAWNAQLARPLWGRDKLKFASPEFVLEDIRIGTSTASYLAPEFLPGGSRVAFLDGVNTLWLGELDPVTGLFVSGHGRDLSVDSGLASLASAADGPEWGFNSSGPALFYTKPGAFGHLQIWSTHFLSNGPLTFALTTGQSNESFGVRPSQEPTASSVKIAFSVGAPALSSMVWADENTPSIAAALPQQAGGTLNARWIPGTTDIAYRASPVGQPTPTQIARYRTTNGAVSILTTNAGDKTDVWAFVAPEFGNELCYAAVVDHDYIAIYRDLRDNTNGYFTQVAALTLPTNATQRFIYSMEPVQGLRGFDGTSYFTCAAYQNDNPVTPGDGAIWLLALGPDTNHFLARRVDDGAGSNVAADRREPKTFVGANEVFLYYTRYDGANPVQLHRARTGLKRAEHVGPASGFTSMSFNWSFVAGTTQSNGVFRGGTETMNVVAHNGRLFAGQSSRWNTPYPNIADTNSLTTNWTGAQILVKDSAASSWRVDPNLPPIFRLHLAVEALEEISFTTTLLGAPLSPPTNLLVCGLSDITNIGALVASARVRNDATGDWADSHIDTTTPAAMISFGSHVDRTTNIHRIFAGLSNGEIYRGGYLVAATNFLIWASNNVEHSGTGPVTAFAECNKILYAACGLTQANSNSPVVGGLYHRKDTNATWQLDYQWPYPADLMSAPEEDRLMRGLTAVPESHGASNQVLVGARAWPGVIERIDPAQDHAVTVELDVRDFLARRWGNDLVRQSNVRIAYNGFTAATNPVTGEAVHLVGVWIDHPDASMAPHNGSHFLVRHLDGTYEVADLENFAPQVPAGQTLRGTRCIAVSPFAEDGGNVFYFGGYDTATDESHNTAWIMRGDWLTWPALTISRPEPSAYQLKWPVTTTNWVLESTTELAPITTWAPVSDLPTRSLYEEALSVTAGSNTFFRLRKP